MAVKGTGKIEGLVDEHLRAIGDLAAVDKNLLRLAEMSFRAGALAVAHHLDVFVLDKTQGTRDDAFSRGVDDGLLWVAQELRFLLKGDEA